MSGTRRAGDHGESDVPWHVRRARLKADLLDSLGVEFSGSGWDYVRDDQGLSEQAVESVIDEIADELRRRAARFSS